MTADEFRQAIDRANARLVEERPRYWTCFKRGLQRAQYGDQVVSDDEHAAWLQLAADPDPRQQERGRGYVDGWSLLQACDRVTA